jgi:DNA topoisomerase-1
VATFPEIFSVAFTAQMEDTLDRIEQTEADALAVLEQFYGPFKLKLDAAAEGMLSLKGVGFATDLACPECGQTLHIKVGKNGPFLACSGYPACTYSRDYLRDEKGRVKPVEPSAETLTDKACPKCGKPMVIKRGRYGEFLACSGYPACKQTESLANGGGRATGIGCPAPGCGGELVERKSKRGKVFYGCSRFPECTEAMWDKPVDRPCPACQAPFMVEKTTKRDGRYLACLRPDCGHRESLTEERPDAPEAASQGRSRGKST